MTWPCYYDDVLLGIVGLDVPLGDIVESATYFQQDKSTYAFVIDSKGTMRCSGLVLCENSNFERVLIFTLSAYLKPT